MAAASPSILAKPWDDVLGSNNCKSNQSGRKSKAAVIPVSDPGDDSPSSDSVSGGLPTASILDPGQVTRSLRLARLAANMQVREDEASAYIAHKASLPLRRQEALKRRLLCFLLSIPFLLLSLLFLPVAFTPASSAAVGSSSSRLVMMVLCSLFLCASVLCLIIGYVAGEGWRKGGKTMSEEEMREAIEKRAAEIMREGESEFEAQEERKKREKVEKEKKRLEEVEEIVRAIEKEVGGREGGRKGRRGERKGSVSSTDIKVTEEMWTKEGGKIGGREEMREKALVVVEVGEACGGVKEGKVEGREEEQKGGEQKDGRKEGGMVVIADEFRKDLGMSEGVWV
ncbi:Hypothetical protein NocV09_05300200 [Nannochloropsis oceanica]